MKRLIFSLALIGVAWLVGLAVFISALPQPAALELSQKDGVVVYTGGGARISAGMTLLSDGAAPRLLISGVHPETSRETVAELWSGDAELFECCVDIGREARSTFGNAGETAAWAEQHDVSSIVLVTSDYHMPRALVETRTTMPDIDVTPYVVSSGYLAENGKPTSRKAWKTLAGEYSKYLLAQFKSVPARLGL